MEHDNVGQVEPGNPGWCGGERSLRGVGIMNMELIH